jgi:hypothetical protein
MIAWHNLTIQERTATGWVLSLLVVSLCLLSGCTRKVPLAEDESRIREEFSIPPEIELVSLWRSSDQPGTFGREGLRMVAEFQLTDQQKENFVRRAINHGWRSLPMPKNIHSFRKPPVELPKDAQEGLCFCSVWVSGRWVNGKKQESKTFDCEDAPEKFDDYRVGLLDIGAGKIMVVYQNYY